MAFFEFNRALVRAPSASVVQGLRAAGGPAPSAEGFRKEHVAYVSALQSAGLAVRTLPALEKFPDAVFVEDPALVFANGAILLHPGAPSRRGEVGAIEPHLQEEFDWVLRLEKGQVDGGDVLATPRMIVIGLSARTNAAGASDLIRLLDRLGYCGQVVPTPRNVLHLKSACTLLDEETLLATRAVAQSGILNSFRLLEVPDGEEHAANALRLNGQVLASAEHPRTLDLLSRHGCSLVPLPTAEISRLDAGLTCLSLRWRA